MDLDAILFDAGGVLVSIDYERLRRFACAIVGPSGPSVEDFEWGDWACRPELDEHLSKHSSEVTATRDLYGRLLWREAWKRSGRVPEDAAAVDAWLDRVLRSHEENNLWCRLTPKVLEGLETIAATGRAMAVISNADGRVESLLEERGLTRHMRFVLDSALEGVEKPDPEIFHRALRRLDLEARRCLYVGDFYAVDVCGARNAGLRAVLVDPGKVWGKKDVLTCSSVADLAQRLV